MEIYQLTLNYPRARRTTSAVQRLNIVSTTDVAVADFDEIKRVVTVGVAHGGAEFVVALSEKDIVAIYPHLQKAVAAILGAQ